MSKQNPSGLTKDAAGQIHNTDWRNNREERGRDAEEAKEVERESVAAEPDLLRTAANNQLVDQQKTCFGCSFSNVIICCFSLFFFFLHWISLGFGVLVGQNSTFEDVNTVMNIFKKYISEGWTSATWLDSDLSPKFIDYSLDKIKKDLHLGLDFYNSNSWLFLNLRLLT